jgi:D-alanyl-D-alanine dipeptidase
LIDIQKLAPGIVVDLRYATQNNFTGQQLYPVSKCLLCQPVAERLARVQNKLEKKNLGLKVWDCYRPLSIQKKLWSLVPDPRYVADPKTGSRHNRGASIDLTLVDSQGKELPMPTEFDEFSNKAHRDFMDLPSHIIQNRLALQTAMEEEGFSGLPTEWWHFDDPEWNLYALRDEPLGSSHLKKDESAPGGYFNLTHVQQLIVVTAPDWNSTTGALQLFEREKTGWVKKEKSWAISLGDRGLAWGRGLHGEPLEGPIKKEGDKTAPAGLFKIGQAYGSDKNLSFKTSWPYQPVDKNWVCVDDPRSGHYNQIFLNDSAIKKDWSSCEIMGRADGLYKWVITIEQNPDRQKGGGSCVFLHVWRKPGSATEGCTAMDEAYMIKILSWLNPDKNPHIVQLPQSVYDKVKTKWDLP